MDNKDCPLCGRWDCECEELFDTDEEFELMISELIKKGLL